MTTYSNRINVIASSRSIPSLRLMITNTQNVSAPAGLQVLATVPLTFGKYSVDFDKIAFYYNGNPVYSWVESVSNLNMNVWLKMSVSIPANTSITINAMPNIETVFDNNYWGCAPTLTSQYGQYDNGANVFNNYWNFAGTSLPSGWVNNGESVTVNNGVSLTPSGATGKYWARDSITYNQNFAGQSYVFETYAKITTLGYADTNPAMILNSNSSTSYSSSYNIVHSGVDITGTKPGYFVATQNPSGTITTVGITPSPYNGYSNFNLYQTFVNGASVSVATNYGSILATQTTYNPSTQYPAIGNYKGVAAPTLYVQWTRIRAYPPNGVMPSVTVSY